MEQTGRERVFVTDQAVTSWQDWVPAHRGAPCPATGPELPLPMLTADPALPIGPVDQAAALWVVGAHGGAGESTLAGLSPGWAAAEHRWPDAPSPAWCVLTARTSLAGLLAAQAALRQWAAGDTPVHLAGLVLLADAPGTLPRPLRELGALIAGGAPRCWSIPWIERWRHGELHITRDLARLIRDLTAVTDTTRRTK